MFERYKIPLMQVWNVCSKPDNTLRYEALLNAFYGKNILRQCILPLAEVLFVAGFIRFFVFGNQDIATAVVKSIFDYLSFVVSYGVLFYLVRWVSVRFFDLQFEERNVSMMVVSLMSVSFVVKLFLSLMPNMFFVNFFYVYILYLVWVASSLEVCTLFLLHGFSLACKKPQHRDAVLRPSKVHLQGLEPWTP